MFVVVVDVGVEDDPEETCAWGVPEPEGVPLFVRAMTL